MGYLVIDSEDGVAYDLEEIYSIRCDLAQNVLDKSKLKKRNLKPLETVIVISFSNGDTAIFSTVGLEIHFDQ